MTGVYKLKQTYEQTEGYAKPVELRVSLHSYVQSDGAVVAPHRLVADLAVAQARQQGGRQHKVVEPPAHVL